MATRTFGAVVIVVTAFLAAGPIACTPGSGLAEPDKGKPVIGLVLSDSQAARWERFDRPLIERRIRELCHRCRVQSVNAEANVSTQLEEVDAMVSRDVEALIVAPGDARAIRSAVEKAEAAGVPVIAYDRLAEGPISAYVSFNNKQVGRLQGAALLRVLGDRAASSQIVMVNGASSDPNAALLTKGALEVLEDRVEISSSFDTPDWSPVNAYNSMAGVIADIHPAKVDAVYAANDGLAAGAIAALREAKVDPLPPVTGQDVELAAVQRILMGDQYMSVYKPYRSVAFAAAEMTVALIRGESLDDIARTEVHNRTTRDIPSVLASPISVTVRNIEETVVKDGLYTVDQICTARFESACVRAGLR